MFVVAANWKMHKSPSEAVSFFKDFLPKVSARPTSCEVIFFVPAIDLWVTQQALRNSGIGWGAQNCHFESKGAFTGENSPAVIAELGSPYTLVGHSERRALFHETDEESGKKVQALQKLNVTPMLCVGESLNEREAGKTDDVIKRQLRAGLAQRDPKSKLMIAYEPVWAIGTGKVASPAQANDAHATLRRELIEIGGAEFAKTTPILYGGSVKPDNANEIALQKEVDGFLIGGASLEIASMLALCEVGFTTGAKKTGKV